MSPQQDPARLGEYRLLEKLGHGGMAMVYSAERTGEAGFKKKVAIKRMLPQFRRNPSLLERFAAEARTNARLDHPNLVQVVDFGIEPEPYLVMEFVEGVTLAALLQRLIDKKERLEVAAACFIGAEAAQGLDHAHRKRDEAGTPLGIVHRDVSPQNVLLSNEGAVKVSDFGLVKAADNVVQTGSGVPVGKMSYMAPEQSQNIPIDARADVFSLGIVVWEMFSMRPLLPHNDPIRVGKMLLTCDFPLPSSLNPNVPPALDTIVMSCLSRDAGSRTPSAQALSMQLREVLHEIAPGYGREQLARLVSWAFPERGWTIDEPHAPAAQPSAAERSSMPHVAAAGAMQRASLAQAAPVARPAQPAPRRTSSPVPWVVLIAAIVLVGLGVLAVILAILLALVRVEDRAQAKPREPSAPSVVPAAPRLWIETNAPATRVWLGQRELGIAPVSIGRDELAGQSIVAIAPGHQPAVLDAAALTRVMNEGRTRESVLLSPAVRPDSVVFVRFPREARARLAFPRRPLGTVPGVLVVPMPRPGALPPIIEIVENDRLVARISTADCDPRALCVLESGAL